MNLTYRVNIFISHVKTIKFMQNSNTIDEGGLVSIKYELTYNEKTNEFIIGYSYDYSK